MKTAREYIMEANEGYDFYTVISNLTEDQILDSMKEYALEVAKESLCKAAQCADMYQILPNGEAETNIVLYNFVDGSKIYINKQSIINAPILLP